MPATARLSRRFYDVLSEDIANELVEWFNLVDATYRSDLRELNELNFARFDAKVGQRALELRQAIIGLRADSDIGLERTRADLIRWMFLSWAGSVAASILARIR